MSFIDRWRESRDKAWWAQHRREHRWDALGKFNAERARGVVHTKDWETWMAAEQKAFNEEQRQQWEADGYRLVDGVLWR